MIHIEQWLIDWARMLDGLIGVVTFTVWRPQWSIYVTIWSLQRRLDREEGW